MAKAINAVISKEMGVNKTAEQFDMPRTTLKDRISGRVKHGAKPGPPGFLTPEEDQELVDFLVECCKMGEWKNKEGSNILCEEVGGEEKNKRGFANDKI